MGDEAARRTEFELAYRASYAAICGYVLRRIPDAEDAAEVVADTFLTLWRRWDDAPAGDSLRPWLFGVARHAIANHHRGERRRTALAQRVIAEFAVIDAQVDPPHAEADSRVSKAFAQLAETDREVLALVAWEGMTREEIATVLEIGRPAVRLRLHRARRRFAAALQRTAETEHLTERRAVVRPGVEEAP